MAQDVEMGGGGYGYLLFLLLCTFHETGHTNDDDDDAHSLRGRIANSEKNSRKRVITTGSYGTTHGTHKGGNNSSVAELR